MVSSRTTKSFVTRLEEALPVLGVKLVRIARTEAGLRMQGEGSTVESVNPVRVASSFVHDELFKRVIYQPRS